VGAERIFSELALARKLKSPRGERSRSLIRDEEMTAEQAWNQFIRYVEKKTREFAVKVARMADCSSPIGAGFAEIGFILESLRSSASTLRCSCRGGRLVCVITHILSRRWGQ